MKRILWLSNVLFTKDEKISATGGWLQPLADGITSTGIYEIINIAFGCEKKIKKTNINGVTQWILPKAKLSDNGQTASKLIQNQVLTIIEKEKPDLVHVWGTEGCWASIFALNYIETKKLLDIQGLLFRCYKFYYGGLDIKDLLKCIHLKEIIMPWRSLFEKKNIFFKRGQKEIEYLTSFENISYQSEWVKNSINYIVPESRLFHTRLLLRNEFYKCKPWQYSEIGTYPIIFSSTSAAVSYKGYHRLIQAIYYIKKKYPNIRLRLAGNMNVGNRLTDGYSIYLRGLIDKYNLQENIVYLGSLNAEQIIQELQNANVCVIPSFVESYCLAFAEAMIVGCPTVCAFSGAMPEQADNEKEALFYNPDDSIQCAALVEKLLKDKELATRLSQASRKRKLIDNNRELVIKTQIEIYDKILG